MSGKPLVLNAEEVFSFYQEVFPAVKDRYSILELEPMRVCVRRETGPEDIRPGGTVSGPAMFEAADCAFYLITLAMIGREALTVTTNATINFLNKPDPVALICEARILKLGRLLVTGDATIRSEGSDRPVAHATLTYSNPPKRG